MLKGLEIVVFDETERDGESRVGPKHWRIFEIIAREPAQVDSLVRHPTPLDPPGLTDLVRRERHGSAVFETANDAVSTAGSTGSDVMRNNMTRASTVSSESVRERIHVPIRVAHRGNN